MSWSLIVTLGQGLSEVCDAQREARLKAQCVRERVGADHSEWFSESFLGLIVLECVCVVPDSHTTILKRQYTAQVGVLPSVDNSSQRTGGRR